MDPCKTHGAFSWCELMTTDLEAAKKFYGELLGWKIEDHETENMAYSVIKNGGKAMGGMMELPSEAGGAPPHWGPYITVKDVDAVAEKALQMGATAIVSPRDIPGIGRFFMFRDPQGAMIAVISYQRKSK